MTPRELVRLQGAYYVASGALPLVSMKLFERITGPKRDRWLVRMVALLAVSIGTSLFMASGADEMEGSTLTLSISAALSFASIDVIYSARKTISPIYLADAALEVLLLGMLARSYFK